MAPHWWAARFGFWTAGLGALNFRLTAFPVLGRIGVVDGALRRSAYFIAARIARMGFHTAHGRYLNALLGSALAFALFQGARSFGRTAGDVFNAGSTGGGSAGDVHSAHGNVARNGLVGRST